MRESERLKGACLANLGEEEGRYQSCPSILSADTLNIAQNKQVF